LEEAAMDYHNFTAKAKMQDLRNNFGKNDMPSAFLPDPLKLFFLNCNPIDVEIRLQDYSQIKFYSITDLEKLQDDYDFPESAFCFATNNSDPIFIRNNKIFTMPHEGGKQYDQIADSFDNYLELLAGQM
jgi:hypothetical protein